jgi:hypothetical protein
VPGLTEQQRALVMAEVSKQPYASAFSEDEVDFSIDSAITTFAPFEQQFAPGWCLLQLRSKCGNDSINFVLEAIPAFLCAHRAFGECLPVGLQQKLTNPTQTRDTLSELMCLGAFQPYHRIHYEPALADGKMPDLLLALSTGQDVYIECKSQRVMDSEHNRLFSKAAHDIHQILEPGKSTFVDRAWEEGLRCEVFLSRTPSNADICELREFVSECVLAECITPVTLANGMRLSLVPRPKPFDEKLPHPSAVILVETTGTDVVRTNVRVAVYPWPGLDIIQRRSQRHLLSSARRKLRSIPPGTYGLICIQTFDSRNFAPDVHRLIEQKAFERIPIVWLNPMGPGRVICRDDALGLRDSVFEGLFNASRQRPIDDNRAGKDRPSGQT